MLRNILLAAAVGLAAVTVSATAAQADDATVTQNLNVRTGPGTHYATVGVLAAGTRVELNGCHDGWCSVAQGPLQGWASELYLQRIHVGVVIVPPPIIIHPPHLHKPWRPHPLPHPWPHHPRPPHPKPPEPPRPPHHKPKCRIAPGFNCP